MDETHHQTKTPNEMNTPPTESTHPDNTAVIPDPIFGGMQKAPTEAPVTTSPPVTRCAICSIPIPEEQIPRFGGLPAKCFACELKERTGQSPEPAPLRWREHQRRMAAQPKAAAPTLTDKPEHYPEIDPWKLQEHMQSSGDAFLDGRRCDATKYSFRTKGGTLEDYRKDMIKARNATIAAIARIDYLLTK